MKKLFLTLLIFMFWVGFANAATLRWDAVTDTSTCVVVNYTVYAQLTTGGAEKVFSVGNTAELVDLESTLNLIPNQEYQFTVTAWSAGGEGPRQEEPLLWTYVVEAVTIPGNSVGDTVIVIPGKVGTLIIQNGQ